MSIPMSSPAEEGPAFDLPAIEINPELVLEMLKKE